MRASADPLNPGLQTLAGTERVNGFEFGAQGRITDELGNHRGLHLSRSDRDRPRAAPAMSRPDPEHRAQPGQSLDDLRFRQRSAISAAGSNYLGRVSAGTDNATVPGSIVVAHVPSHVTFDAMVGYQINDKLSLQLNGYNLTNEYYFVNSYFTRPGENHTVPAPGARSC